jgi:hypothetical protein
MGSKRMRVGDATEGRVEGTISEREHQSFGTEQTRNPFGDGETGTGSRSDGLFTGSGSPFGSSDSGDSSAKTGRKRGRPPGSKSKSIKSALSAERLAAARRKLANTFSGVVGFSVSWYGVYRGNKYKKFSPFLAQKVYGCYQIDKETAFTVGEPLADAFIEWFPDHVETAGKAIDPGLAIANLFIILQQTSENERLTVEDFQQKTMRPETTSTNGNGIPRNDVPEEPINEWMNQQSPTPEEIHPSAATEMPI